MKTPITMDLAGVPLRRTLKLIAEQLGMGYGIKDGMVTITAPNFRRRNWSELLVMEESFPMSSPLELEVERARRGELTHGRAGPAERAPEGDRGGHQAGAVDPDDAIGDVRAPRRHDARDARACPRPTDEAPVTGPQEIGAAADLGDDLLRRSSASRTCAARWRSRPLAARARGWRRRRSRP